MGLTALARKSFTEIGTVSSFTSRRRDFLRTGAGLALASSSWPATSLTGSPRAPSARSCILIYLLGGPPHQDMFDLKPDAPAEVRGPFRPIATSVPGVQICEHLPRLAKQADRYALLRAVSHPNSNHTPMIYFTLTGRETALPLVDNDIRPPQRTDFPHLGSVVSHLQPPTADLPGYVAIPELAVRSSISGEFKRTRSPLRGGNGGFLGPKYDPLCVDGEPGLASAVPALTLPEHVSRERLAARQEVLAVLDKPRGPVSPSEFDVLRRQAFTLTGAANSERAPLFSLDAEPAAVRDRYGRHRFGQACLLARRLTEAGVPLVAIHFNEMTVCDGWDTHSKNFEALQTELLPYLDQGLSALMDDLTDRGRLNETLIACFGEFGRTPKINANAGRDHWGDCSTTLLAGGGVRGGVVFGESDRHAAYPLANRVDPVDVQATIYHCLGISADALIYDQLRRPNTVTLGEPILDLFG
jgi:hypothetical protein